MKRIVQRVGIAACWVFLSLFPLTGFGAFFDTNNCYGWQENVGWVTLSAGTCGVEITKSFVKGYAWCGNVGWLNMGQGPSNGIAYSQSEGDVGVNADGHGGLSGYAWGENVGWVCFDACSLGGASVTYAVDGALSGYAWGENIGWLCFGKDVVQNATIIDQDSDGLSDLSETDTGVFNDGYDTGSDPLEADTDHDGMGDGDELRSGTDPVQYASCLKILGIERQAMGILVEWRTVYGHAYYIQACPLSSLGAWTNLTHDPIMELNEFPEGVEAVLDLLVDTNCAYRVIVAE